MLSDYPNGITLAASALALIAWLPILVALAYVLRYRARLQHPALFVLASALLAWGAADALSYLFMPFVVWFNASAAFLPRGSSSWASLAYAGTSSASFAVHYQFIVSFALLLATSFCMPSLLFGRIWPRLFAQRG